MCRIISYSVSSRDNGAGLIEILVAISLFVSSVAILSKQQVNLLKTYKELRDSQYELNSELRARQLLSSLAFQGIQEDSSELQFNELEVPLRAVCIEMGARALAPAYRYYSCQLKNVQGVSPLSRDYHVVKIWTR